MWTMCAWLNHADSRGPNSLDMWVTENGRSFVRHHLDRLRIEPGRGGAPELAPIPRGPSTTSTSASAVRQLATPGIQAVRLGGLRRTLASPSVGFIASETFDPAGWRPDYPNPAFDERTDRDIRWERVDRRGFHRTTISAPPLPPPSTQIRVPRST
mgnify:CR=1 FL=1